jgi:putative peptidoglycan lipid II flippase
VIAQSIAIAVFPTFSAQVASGDQKALATTLGQVLRSVIFLSLPATVGLVVLRLPLVQVILQRGEFSFEDSQSVAWALLFYGIGLVFHSILEIITRAFYALHDTRTPVLIGGGATILNVVFSLIFMRVIGVPGSLAMGPFGGLALANTVATTLEVIALLILIRPRVGGLEMPALSATVLRSGLASLVMGLGLWIVIPFLNGDGLFLALKVIGSMLAGGLIYWGLAWGLGSDEARLFTRVILQRLEARHVKA